MSHPNTKEFLATVTSKENKTKTIAQAGGNPASLAGGGAKKAAGSNKKKSL